MECCTMEIVFQHKMFLWQKLQQYFEKILTLKYISQQINFLLDKYAHFINITRET